MEHHGRHTGIDEASSSFQTTLSFFSEDELREWALELYRCCMYLHEAYEEEEDTTHATIAMPRTTTKLLRPTTIETFPQDLMKATSFEHEPVHDPTICREIDMYTIILVFSIWILYPCRFFSRGVSLLPPLTLIVNRTFSIVEEDS